MAKEETEEFHRLSRLALQIAAQLPTEPSEALQVLEIAADVVRFLDRRDGPPADNVHRLWF